MTDIEQGVTHNGNPVGRKSLGTRRLRVALASQRRRWMRKLCSFAVVGIGAVLAAAPAAAADSPVPASTSAAPPASAPKKPDASPRRPRAHFFVGEVVEIPTGEGKFSVRETLRDGPPKVTFFLVMPETTVSRGKERAAFADLKVNDHVTIKYAESTSPEKQAISIRITPSARPAAAAAPTPPPPRR